MSKMANNIQNGLEAELEGLEARLAVANDKPGTVSAEMVANLERRVVEVKTALGRRAKAPTKNTADSTPKETRG